MLTRPDNTLRLRAYMLRFWEVRTQEPDCPTTWRFSLEDPHSGEKYGFADFGALVQFIETELASDKKK